MHMSAATETVMLAAISSHTSEQTAVLPLKSSTMVRETAVTAVMVWATVLQYVIITQYVLKRE